MNKNKEFRVRFNYYVEVDVVASNKDEAYQMALAVVDSNKLDDIIGYDSSEIHELNQTSQSNEYKD